MKTQPSPPPDLWERLKAIEEELHKPPEPPAGSFSVYDYAAKKGISASHASHRIRVMERAGKIVRIGTFGKALYYRLP